MQTYVETIPEFTRHMLGPISAQLVRKIIMETGTDHIFTGDKLYLTMDSIGGSRSADVRKNAQLKDDRFTCVMVPNLNPRELKWDTSRSGQFGNAGMLNIERDARLPVFFDYAADTILTEHCLPCTITLECTMQFMDKVRAVETLNKLYTMYTNGEIFTVTDLAYDYKIPENIYSLMYMVYKMTGTFPGKFLTYLRTHSDNQLSLNTARRLEQKDFELIVQKNAFNTLVQLDLSQNAPESEQEEKSPDIFNVQFTMTTQFNRPNMLMLRYPIAIYNQLIPEYAVMAQPNAKLPSPNASFRSFALNDALAMFSLDKNPSAPVVVPWYDNWRVPVSCILKTQRYHTYFIQAFTIDDTDNPEGVTELDLAATYDVFYIKPEIVEEIVALGTDALFFGNKHHIAVFVNDELAEPTELSIVGSKVIIPNRDITKRYHLVLSEKGVENGRDSTLRVLGVDIRTN